MIYTTLYYLHIAAVVFSGSFFLIRGVWMLTENRLLDAKFVRVAPHVNDTVLLGAAIGLAVLTQQYPISQAWLTVKVIALIAYILLGMFSLRRGPRIVRVTCFVGAILTFVFMLSVALTRNPLGLFSFAG